MCLQSSRLLALLTDMLGLLHPSLSTCSDPCRHSRARACSGVLGRACALCTGHKLTASGLVQGILELEASVIAPGAASASQRPHDQTASASSRPHEGEASASSSRSPHHHLSNGQGLRVGEQGRVAGKRGRPSKSDLLSPPEPTRPSKPLPSPPIPAEPRQRALALNALGCAAGGASAQAAAGSSCVSEGSRGGGDFMEAAKGGFMGAGLSDSDCR